MKNLFLSVILLITVSFAFAANDAEKDSTNNIEETVISVDSLECSDANFPLEITTSLEVGGRCCITIYDSNGNVVYSECLPANTPEACEAMLQAILDDMNKD